MPLSPQDPTQIIREPQPRDLAHLVLHIHQQLGEPGSVASDMQPTDQRRPVGIRPLEDFQQLSRRGFTERGDDALADVLAHAPRLEAATVPASTDVVPLTAVHAYPHSVGLFQFPAMVEAAADGRGVTIRAPQRATLMSW